MSSECTLSIAELQCGPWTARIVASDRPSSNPWPGWRNVGNRAADKRTKRHGHDIFSSTADSRAAFRQETVQVRSWSWPHRSEAPWLRGKKPLANQPNEIVCTSQDLRRT